MDRGVILISPIAERPRSAITAPRPRRRPGLRVSLIDGMENRRAGWGRALLDGAEDVLSSQCLATFDRIERPLGGTSFSEDPEWLRGMAGQVDLVVEAVGD